MYLNELSNVCIYMFLISSVMNLASCVESVLLRMIFIVVISAVGVSTLSGYSIFWPETVILVWSYCSLFARISHTKEEYTAFTGQND